MERWQALPPEERISYENQAQEVHNKSKGSAGGISGTQLTSIKGFMSKSVSPKNVTKKSCQRPYRREVALDVSLQKLKESGIAVRKDIG